MGRIAVIGFDGATWRVLRPLIDEGRMPSLAGLIDSGSSGILWSTTPAVTFPAWHSMLSGLNPGKVGVYGFAQVDVGAGRYVLNTVNSFRGDPVWRIAGEYGLRSVVINVPTARVEPVRGAIVGGPFTAGRLVYPREYAGLVREAGYEAYPEELSKSMLHRGSKPGMDSVRKAIGSRFRVARLLLERMKPDLLVMVIFVIDNLQHFYWGDSIVEEAWEYIDEELGRLLKELGGYNVLVVSDHGFTRGTSTVSTTMALEEYGLVTVKRRGSKLTMLGGLVKLGARLGVARAARRIPWLYSKLANMASRLQQGEWVGAKALEAMIDWRKSKLIPVDSLLYVNPRACPRREECLSQAEEALHGVSGVKTIHRAETIYTGPLHGAPDLIVEGETGVDIVDSPNMEAPVVEGLVRPGWRAIHEPQGILVASGPDVEPGRRLEANIVDVAPTVLAHLGVPLYDDIDGAPIPGVAPDRMPERPRGRSLAARRAREALRKRLKGKR
ncbi:MAG: alkaline phosphatase family protein [Desulfurococcales archaeon]|nr:alkaline phosphatase family protein [Desulfurococcales archaeon]